MVLLRKTYQKSTSKKLRKIKHNGISKCTMMERLKENKIKEQEKQNSKIAYFFTSLFNPCNNAG